MKLGIVVGNPKPRSRTLQAALAVGKGLGAPDPYAVIDVADLGEALFDRNNSVLKGAVNIIQSCDVVIFASPTFKSSYSGLLKLLLDQLPPDGLKDIVALPLMLGAGMAHALAPDLLLKPILVELGAICPMRGLYLLESEVEASSALDNWLERARPVVSALTAQGVNP
jgi:FMN reductase